MVDDGALVTAATPRVLLRAGRSVRVRFGGPPTEVVRLETRTSRFAGARVRRYRLSPVDSAWRARPGSGVIVVSTMVPAPGVTSSGTILGTWAVVYRATARPVVPGSPPAAVGRRTPLPTCGVERLRQGDDGARSAPRRCLAEAIGAVRPAELISTRPTVEGDPITTIVRVLGSGRVEVIEDATADRFGNRRSWTIRRCVHVAPRTLTAAGCGPARAL